LPVRPVLAGVAALLSRLKSITMVKTSDGMWTLA
jgi:hypothetical protein